MNALIKYIWVYSLTLRFLQTSYTLHQKFDTSIPRNETARHRSQFVHSCICERFIYFHNQSAFFSCIAFTDRSWEYINCKQIHECRNWEWGRAISFLGIFVSNFRGNAFAVQWIQYIKYTVLNKICSETIHVHILSF